MSATDFIPPPCYTTVRVNHGVAIEEAVKTLQEYVDADISSRGTFEQDICVEPHPILTDLLLVTVSRLDCIPKYDNQVIVGPSCGLAVLRGAHIFVPGIIAAPTNLKSDDFVSVFVDLEKKCLKGSQKFEGKKCFIGNGQMKVSRHDVFVLSCRSGVGVLMNEPLYLTPCLDISILPKIFFPQNLPSVVVGHVLSPPKNSIVLDMCAAPGGKTTHLCSIMHNTGKVIALDRSCAKVLKINEHAHRLGVSDCVFSYTADSRKIVSENALKISCRKNEFSPPYPPQSFSYILLDAPCSALGQRPKFPIAFSKCNVSSYHSLQWRLVECAMKLLATGGTLVYSTCTTTYDENERMVQKILEQYPSITLEKQIPHLGGYGRKEASTLDRGSLEKLQYFDELPTQSTNSHPADTDTIGFFIAKFKKNDVELI